MHCTVDYTCNVHSSVDVGFVLRNIKSFYLGT